MMRSFKQVRNPTIKNRAVATVIALVPVLVGVYVEEAGELVFSLSKAIFL